MRGSQVRPLTQRPFFVVVLPRRVCARHRVTRVCVGNSSWCLCRAFGLWWHFILPTCTTRDRRGSNVQLGSACARMPVYYRASSVVVVVGVEDRPPFGNLGCALRHHPALILRGHPGLAPWLPHEGLANGEGGRAQAPATRRGPAPGVPTR